jgi:hypothetical protein
MESKAENPGESTSGFDIQHSSIASASCWTTSIREVLSLICKYATAVDFHSNLLKVVEI